MLKLNTLKSIESERFVSKNMETIINSALNIEYWEKNVPNIDGETVRSVLSATPSIVGINKPISNDTLYKVENIYLDMLKKITDKKKEYSLTGEEKFFLDAAILSYIDCEGDEMPAGTKKEKDTLLHDATEKVKSSIKNKDDNSLIKESDRLFLSLLSPSSYMAGEECDEIISVRTEVPREWNAYTGEYFYGSENR